MEFYGRISFFNRQEFLLRMTKFSNGFTCKQFSGYFALNIYTYTYIYVIQT